MIEALRNVQNVRFDVTAFAEAGQKIVEIARVRFVGPNVLGGVYGVEFYAEAGFGGHETPAIDVGQNDQLEIFLQRAERCGAVGKGWPISNRVSERAGHVIRWRRRVLRAKSSQHVGEDGRIARRGGLGFLGRLVQAKFGQQRVVVDAHTACRPPRCERRENTAFPIDQGPVAVKGQYRKVGKPHPHLLREPVSRPSTQPG